ncbi:MAG: fasciclin domain-containing protein, partial [Phycisphaerae bacterium]|nr:fasciclin domain-containing protein [Phycisphaerae bacterium]
DPTRDVVVSSADIVETAAAAGNFTTLLAALKAADLVDALKGKGPFTVFAPSDEAFAKLPAGTVETLLKPENKAQLVSLLKYHVVPAKAMSADAASMTFAPTLQGQRINLKAVDGKLTADNAKIVKADIAARNGVIHVIDSVLMPTDGNAYEVARGLGTFGILLAAVDASGLAEMLKQPGPFTILAPSDTAFQALPKGTIETLLKPENKPKLAQLIGMHVIPGALVYSDGIAKMPEVRTLMGTPLKVVSTNGKMTIGEATVTKADVESSNAVIHVVDRVIMPAGFIGDGKTATASEPKSSADPK